MGDFNARTAALAPSVDGQLPHISTDLVFDACSCALLSLLMQHKLQPLSGTTQLSHHAFSIGRSGPEFATSVVGYAIASRDATPWVTGVTIGDAWPMLSNHCPLILSLALPAPSATHISAVPTLQACWELGVYAYWQAHLSSPLFLACL